VAAHLKQLQEDLIMETIQAISTYKARLMRGTGESLTYSMLIPITSFPQIGGAPEQIETTTMEDIMQTFIQGIQSAEAMEFGTWYDSDAYDELKKIEGKKEKYSIWFGNNGDGAAGKFNFEGQLAVYINEGEVNSAIGMTVSITPNSPVTKATE
jgi:hypothetical protein